jgi:hypothetical protein
MRPKFQNSSQSILITHNPNIQNFFDYKIPTQTKQTNKQKEKANQVLP